MAKSSSHPRSFGTCMQRLQDHHHAQKHFIELYFFILLLRIGSNKNLAKVKSKVIIFPLICLLNVIFTNYIYLLIDLIKKEKRYSLNITLFLKMFLTISWTAFTTKSTLSASTLKYFLSFFSCRLTLPFTLVSKPSERKHKVISNTFGV